MGKVSYHIRFWLLSLVFFALAIYFYFFSSDSIVDINVYDTYYLIAYPYVFQWFGLWFILCGLGYWIVYKLKVKMLKWMHWVHIALSLLPFLIMPLLIFVPDEPSGGQIGFFISGLNWMLLGLLGFLIGQIVYFLNILISTIRYKRN